VGRPLGRTPLTVPQPVCLPGDPSGRRNAYWCFQK
jgi:hypothetical protein